MATPVNLGSFPNEAFVDSRKRFVSVGAAPSRRCGASTIRKKNLVPDFKGGLLDKSHPVDLTKAVILLANHRVFLLDPFRQQLARCQKTVATFAHVDFSEIADPIELQCVSRISHRRPPKELDDI